MPTQIIVNPDGAVNTLAGVVPAGFQLNGTRPECAHCEIEQLIARLEEGKADVLTYLKAKSLGALNASEQSKADVSSCYDYAGMHKVVGLGLASTSIQTLINELDGLWLFIISQRHSKLPACSHGSKPERIACLRHVDAVLLSTRTAPAFADEQLHDEPFRILFDSDCPQCHAQQYSKELQALKASVLGYIRRKAERDREEARSTRIYSDLRSNGRMKELFAHEAALFEGLAEELERIWPDLHSLCERYRQGEREQATKTGFNELTLDGTLAKDSYFMPPGASAARVKNFFDSILGFLR